MVRERFQKCNVGETDGKRDDKMVTRDDNEGDGRT